MMRLRKRLAAWVLGEGAAENARLMAEVERLTAEVWKLEGEVERLEAEIDRAAWPRAEVVRALTDWDNLARSGGAKAAMGADIAFDATHAHTRQMLASLSAAGPAKAAA
jgi:predicted RNase H-like nuclease (RuvC/YqgF family)